MPSGGGWVGAGEVISAEELVREVWGPQYKEEIGFVRRYVWRLRQKVEKDPEKPALHPQ